MRTLISRFFFVTPMMWLLVAQLAPSLTASSEQEQRKQVDDPDEYAVYKEYPGAPGAISFTRVGFNKKKDQAPLYVARQGGFVGGSAVFFVLSRGGDAWKIEKEVILWLS